MPGQGLPLGCQGRGRACPYYIRSWYGHSSPRFLGEPKFLNLQHPRGIRRYKGALADSFVKSFTKIIAYLTEMCYTLIVSFTIIYSVSCVLNESVPGKDAEGSPKNRGPDADVGQG